MTAGNTIEQTPKVDVNINYEKEKVPEMKIEAKEINELITNGWKAGTVSFGTLESRFEDYDIYFDEGIEVKTLGAKVYNIIFTEKYAGNIINGFKVNDTKEKIQFSLGEPTFEDENVIGYKGDKIYVFFSQNEVSVYRVEDDYQTEKFLEIVNELYETKNANTFISKLTNLWPDYDEFMHTEKSATLKYSLKGLTFKVNSDRENGLGIYKNYGGYLAKGITLDNLTEDNMPKYMYLHLDTDLVFEKEKLRKESEEVQIDDEYRAMNDYTAMAVRNLNGEGKDGLCFSNLENDEFKISYEYTEKGKVSNVKFISKQSGITMASISK